MAIANTFDSNITRKLIREFTEDFQAARVITQNVGTQPLRLTGRYNPSTGDKVDFKRPTDFISVRTERGDLSATDPSAIQTGKATGTVQDYLSVYVEYDIWDESLMMDQKDRLLKPIAERLANDLETHFVQYMTENSGLLSGDWGEPVASWSDVANAGALMDQTGVPQTPKWCYAVNPHTQVALATEQRSLGSGGSSGTLISEAHRMAIISDDFAGFKVMKSNILGSITQPAATTDRVGALSATPDGTYETAKDTFTQSLAVSGFGTSGDVIPAGTFIEVTARSKLNQATRNLIFDEAGESIPFSAVLVEPATLVGGAGTFIVAGPGLNELAGQYNNIDTPLTIGDTVTILGQEDRSYQPNLFWHKSAFNIGFVDIKPLQGVQNAYSRTKDGVVIRVVRDSDVLANKQVTRFDIQTAYLTSNSFFAGQGWGSA